MADNFSREKIILPNINLKYVKRNKTADLFIIMKFLPIMTAG